MGVNGALAVAAVNRAIDLIGTEPSATLCRLRLLRAVSLAVIGDMEGSSAELSEAKQIELGFPELLTDGFPLMCEARVRFQLAQMSRSEECAHEALRRFRAAGDLWGQAEVFEPVAAALSLGRVSELDNLLVPALALAERVGHLGAIWTYKAYSAERLLSYGDLEEADLAIEEANRFSEASSIGWHYVNFIISGGIAYYRGDLDEAERRVRKGLKLERLSYLSGQLIGELYLVLAAKGDPGAEAALAEARLHLPIPGRPMSLGACGCLASVLEGLAIAGRSRDAADLEAAAEYMFANGPLCSYYRQLLRTAAGIAATAAGNWARAEEHFRTAIQQAESAPYWTAQPVARLRYSEMLLARGLPGDADRARQLLAEALHLFESMGMRWYAQRARERISAFGAGA